MLLVYLALFSDISQKDAQGVNLLFFIPIIIIAVILHIKNKLIDVKTALICGGIGMLSVPIGFWVAGLLDGDILRKVFAVFVIVAGLKDLFSKGVDKCERE